MQQKQPFFWGMLVVAGLSFFNMPIGHAVSSGNIISSSDGFTVVTSTPNLSMSNAITIVRPKVVSSSPDINTSNGLTPPNGVNTNPPSHTSTSRGLTIEQPKVITSSTTPTSNGMTVVRPQNDMNTSSAITVVNASNHVNTNLSQDASGNPPPQEVSVSSLNDNIAPVCSSQDMSAGGSSSNICSNHSTNDIRTSGIELNVYGGVLDLTTKFGNEVVNSTAPSFPPQTNTLVGSTDSAGFEPGFGIAYDFYVAPYNQVRGIDYILNDVSLGVDAYYLRGIRKGSVYYAGEFPSNNYNATLSSWQVMLDTQWDFHPLWKFIPFAQVGVGDAINSLSYNEVSTRNSVPDQIVVNLPRGVHNNFAYDVGGGIKLPTSKHTQLSLRYLYSDLGNVSATSSQLASPLNVNMHSSSLLLGFTYLFG